MTGSSASASSGSDAPAPGGAGATFALPPGEVHLWLARLDAVTDSATFAREVLARYTGAEPDALAFERGEHGKPFLAAGSPGPEFNLSHSRDWLLCAVSGGRPVGADLQYTDSGRDTLKLARRYFSAPEVALLESLPPLQRDECFYDLWSLKEAAVKSRGGALAPGLRALGFELDFPEDGCGRIAPVPAEAHGAARYYLLDLLPRYRMALCWIAARGSGITPTLRLVNPDGKASSPALRAMSAGT